MDKSRFLIRPLVPSAHDEAFVVAALDSTIPYLQAAGNGGMWGSIPFSQKEGFVEATKEELATSQHFRATGEGERLLTWVAEVEVDNNDEPAPAAGETLHCRTDDHGRHFLAAGITYVRDEDFSQHLLGLDSVQSVLRRAREEAGFDFIDMLATDHRVGAQRKGAGAALIEHAKQDARGRGKKWLYIDTYTGGTNDGLVRYYEHLGFEGVADFEIKRKDGSIWPGRLSRMQL